MKWTREDFRRMVMDIIQPMSSAAVDSLDVKGFKAKLDGMLQFGDAPHFSVAYPFGMVARPAKGVFSYFVNLLGSSLAPVILSHLDKNRPIPTAVGQVILYCTDATGEVHPVLIDMKPDGTLAITATLKIQLNAPAVEIGEGTLEKVLNGETFRSRFYGHGHISSAPGVATSTPTDVAVAPLVPLVPAMTEAVELSSVVKASKAVI